MRRLPIFLSPKSCIVVNALISKNLKFIMQKSQVRRIVNRLIWKETKRGMIECDPVKLNVIMKVGDPWQKLKINKVRAAESRRVRDVRIYAALATSAREVRLWGYVACVSTTAGLYVLFSLQWKAVFILADCRRALRIIMQLNARASHKSAVR